MSLTTTKNRPSDRQLRFLKSLAEQTGTSFTYPETRGHASREIERLIELKDSGVTDSLLRVEADERSLVYATAVADDEVSGYGSTASWSGGRVEDRPCDTEPRRIGERTELARYGVSSGERVLYGQRINGGVRITDRPAAGDGRSYLVERELEQDGYSALKALVADYIEQAARLDAVPMASSGIRRELEQLGVDV
jgi:hypothetical protein